MASSWKLSNPSLRHPPVDSISPRVHSRFLHAKKSCRSRSPAPDSKFGNFSPLLDMCNLLDHLSLIPQFHKRSLTRKKYVRLRIAFSSATTSPRPHDLDLRFEACVMTFVFTRNEVSTTRCEQLRVSRPYRLKEQIERSSVIKHVR